MTEAANYASSSPAPISWGEAHRRFGHLSISGLKTLFNSDMVTGIKVDPDSNQDLACEACIQAKLHHQSFPKLSNNRAGKPGDLTHSDLWGPARTTSIGGLQYYISFIDDHLRRITIKFLKEKLEAQQQIQNYVAWIENQLNRLPKAFKFDNGGEFIDQDLQKWLAEKGIESKFTAPHSPQQHGMAEWLNQTLLEIA
jgi:GAG-pre-integrase domain/Integrase core domain